MLKKYMPFLRANIMNMFIYRGSIVLWIIVDILRFVLLIFLWMAVYKNTDSISNFTINDIIIYYLITSFTGVFAQSETMFIMSEEIKQGRISLYLIKPINYKRRLLFECMGRNFGISILVLPIIIIMMVLLKVGIFGFEVGINYDIMNIVYFVLYLPLILLLMFEVTFLFGTFVIHTQNDFGVVILMNVLVMAVSGQLIPLAFYPEGMRNIIELMPFKFISYPPLILLGDKLPLATIHQGFIVLILWIIVFRLVNFTIFKLSMKKMVVFGG